MQPRLWGAPPARPRLALTLPIREANLSFRTFISSFSWSFCCWTAGSTLRSRGTSRLGLTVTWGMAPAGRPPVRLRELKPGPGAPQPPQAEGPGQGRPAGLAPPLLRLLKPTTHERQAMAAAPGPGTSERAEAGGQPAPVAGSAGGGLGRKHLSHSAH